jgi:hypothetical protein
VEAGSTGETLGRNAANYVPLSPVQFLDRNAFIWQ